MPPYFKQINKYACSLAVLRSVLASHGIDVSEEKLITRIKKDYGPNFKNIWNPTVAKLARQYHIDTTMYALWPLFRPDNFKQALKQYTDSPATMDMSKYENPDDKHDLREPLPLAYKEMFEAVGLGCKVIYGNLTAHRLRSLLSNNYLIQTSIRNSVLYTGGKNTYHSLLIYKLKGETVTYHDPAQQAAMTCKIHTLLKASMTTGAFLTYN